MAKNMIIKGFPMERILLRMEYRVVDERVIWTLSLIGDNNGGGDCVERLNGKNVIDFVSKCKQTLIKFIFLTKIIIILSSAVFEYQLCSCLSQHEVLWWNIGGGFD